MDVQMPNPWVTPSPVEQAIRERLEKLLHRRLPWQQALDALVKLEELLESLPLATAEYGSAKCRLRNAQRYLRANEIGAARYELRLFWSAVRHQLG